MARKGISLPINMVVILAVAVLVLVVVAAFFVLQTGQSGQTIRDQDAWASGCANAIAQGCPLSAFETGSGKGLYISRYDPNGDDPKAGSGASQCNSVNFDDLSGCSDDTLRKACERTQGLSDSASCRAKCCGQ